MSFGRAVEAFALTQGLTHLSHASSLLDLFLTTHPVPYSTAVLSPLANSDHGVVEVTFRSEAAVAAETRTGRKTWHYGHADWEGLRYYFSSFPWRDVCFTEADASTEYIPHTVKVPKPGSNGWFNKSRGTARQQKIKAHRTYLQNPTVGNRQADVESRNKYNEAPDIKVRHRVMSQRNGSRRSTIALLSVISKVMESDRQYGFRHQRSTGDLLAYVTQLWSKLIQSHGEAHVVALDITKAFDQLWHAALLSKLPPYGLPEKLCRWVADFISGRKISVVIDGFSSSSHNVNAGVPQGSVLAPTLFLLYINDLLSCTINPIHSFADDSTLHAGIQIDTPISAAELEKRRLVTTSSLTRDLEAITAWGRNNRVQFNASKTQYCTLTNKKRPSAHTVSMDGRVLPKNHSFRLVRVQITEDLIWHDHISSIAAAAGKKLGYLFRAKKYFSPHDLLTLYKAQIRPSLEYCSHIWGTAAPTTLSMLDAVQRRAVRLIDDSSLTDSLGSLSHRRAVGDLALFYRYTNGLCSSELSSMMPPRDVPARQTRLTSATGRYDRSFVPSEAFPSSTNLRQFKNRINKISLGSSQQPRIILHQDNASSHTAQKTRQYLTEENVELLDHPPYSPDVSPNDLFTFPKIKNRLRGQRFQSPEEAVDAFENAVLDLPANEWNKCFENWFERMQMCINLRGEYFEK
ncbi:unnamed protein product [Acanthoscelides obtectus]|uniref:Reverse transcriptase domain-containing protein n=1 Tax=Acanthoscelides obtectus TaxID=200917 RepID=A0A9P0JGW7_ACAOB|nr:unnamed protein product [Acanthoscelides obtectus]CAK1625019.1 RNA-directed DNA polymerase from mobile element jockey [Acanthoscelides obtectus]